MSTEPRAEAEIKIELPCDEFTRLPATLSALAFTPGEAEELVDTYLEYAQASNGKWNFTRLRMANGTRYTLTKKHWQTAEGAPARIEEEHDIPAGEGRNLLANAVAPPITLTKHRDTWHGVIDGEQATIALDRLTIVNDIRCFLECEIMTTPLRAEAVRQRLLAWARTNLHIPAQHEAPSMLEIAMSYAG